MFRREITELLRSIEHHLSVVAEAVGRSEQLIEENRTYSRKDAARLLGVSLRTIDRARQAGKLTEACRQGERDVRIAGESMLDFQRGTRTRSVQVLKI